MSLPETFKGLTPSAVPFGNPEFKDLPLQKPGKDQVLVKVAYSGLCYYDIVQMKNFWGLPVQMLPPIIGNEGCGTIVAVGEDLKTPFKVGDRVHLLRGGCLADYFLAGTDSVYHIREGLSFEEAAYNFINPGTVHYLGHVAKNGGHKAVINTGSNSNLGRQLIKYFKHIGIKTINVVRKDQYIEELTKLGADYVLNSEAPDFDKKLKEVAAKEQATMGADCVGGEMVGKVFQALPPGSTLYCYGALSHDTEYKGINFESVLQKKSLTGLNLNNYVELLKEKGELRKAITEIHDLIPSIFDTKIDKVLKLADLEEAIGLCQKGGKVLIQPN